jgi:hypothetical protein
MNGDKLQFPMKLWSHFKKNRCGHAGALVENSDSITSDRVGLVVHEVASPGGGLLS